MRISDWSSDVCSSDLERYTKEAHRLYGVADKRLAESDYLAGADYSIADIATYPWVARHEWHATNLDDFPNVKRWYEAIGKPEAVQKGMAGIGREWGRERE